MVVQRYLLSLSSVGDGVAQWLRNWTRDRDVADSYTGLTVTSFYIPSLPSIVLCPFLFR